VYLFWQWDSFHLFDLGRPLSMVTYRVDKKADSCIICMEIRHVGLIFNNVGMR
jgi:hypothetical protein